MTQAIKDRPITYEVAARPKRKVCKRGVKKATPVADTKVVTCKSSPTTAHHWVEEIMGSNNWTCKWCGRTAKFNNTLAGHMTEPTSPWKVVSPPRRGKAHRPKEWSPLDHSSY